MDRRLANGPACLLSFASLMGGLSSCGGEVIFPPDIILISLDTLRQDRCSFHGYDRETTPFLAELAEDSLVFDRAYSTASWTLISHASMLTGMYPSQHLVWNRSAAISPEVPTLAERLSNQGMETRGVHFPGWLDARFGFERGFDQYVSADNVEDAKGAVSVLTKDVYSSWFFLFIHLFDIHSDSVEAADSVIYEVPAPYDSMFVADAREKLAGINAKQALNVAAVGFTPEMVDAVGALYDGGVRYVDDRLAAWFAEWTAKGLLDNAIVIITSDHGEGLALREHHFGGHGSFYEEGLKVPLIVHATAGARKWLERERGLTEADLIGRRHELVSHVDLVPTVLDALDMPTDVAFEGVSLFRDVPEDRIVHAQWDDRNAAYRGFTKVRFGLNGRLRAAVNLEEDPSGLQEDKIGPEEVEAIGGELAIDAQKAVAEFFDPGAAGESGGLSEKAASDLRAIGYGNQVDGKD